MISTDTRVQAVSGYVLRSSDTFIVAGCPFFIGPSPHPCVQVQWVQTATRSKAMSDFALTGESVGLCIAADQAPQGVVLISFTQSRVSGL